MERILKPGQNVTLKSGGPKMTTGDYQPTPSKNSIYIECSWFLADGTRKKEFFHQEQLKVIE